jgi:hypothetical protein
MAGFRIEGSVSGNVAEVTATNELQVTLPKVPAQSGIARLYGENDPGTDSTKVVRYGTPYLKPPEISTDFRLRVAEDTLLFTDTFCYAAQNTGEWLYRTDVLTTTWGSGFMTLNGGGVTTIGKTGVQTYRTFPLIGASGFYSEFSLLLTAVPPANWTFDFGVGQMGATTPFAETDGAYFRINSTGVYGVLNFNGTETVSGLLMSAANIGVNDTRKWNISINEGECEFWLDDIFLGEVATPSGNGQPFASGSQPVFLKLIQPVLAGAVCQVKVTDVTLTTADIAMARPWSHQMCTMGQHAYQGQSGGTMGTLANFANSANPAAAVPTNTTAALGTGLGGQFWETDTLAVTTDGIICSFQNPAGSTTVTGRDLVITGVKIESFVQTVLVAGGYNAVWSLAFGHTALPLNTAESATTKAPRRIALGVQTVAAAAAALTQLQVINVDFGQDPVVVHAGEFIACVKKKVGTTASSGVIAHIITFRGHFV